MTKPRSKTAQTVASLRAARRAAGLCVEASCGKRGWRGRVRCLDHLREHNTRCRELYARRKQERSAPLDGLSEAA